MILYKNVSLCYGFTYWSQVEVGTEFGIRLNIVLKYHFVQLTLSLMPITTIHLLLWCFIALVPIVFINLFHGKSVELPNSFILPPFNFRVGFSDEHDVRHVVLCLHVFVVVVVDCSQLHKLKVISQNCIKVVQVLAQMCLQDIGRTGYFAKVIFAADFYLHHLHFLFDGGTRHAEVSLIEVFHMDYNEFSEAFTPGARGKAEPPVFRLVDFVGPHGVDVNDMDGSGYFIHQYNGTNTSNLFSEA